MASSRSFARFALLAAAIIGLAGSAALLAGLEGARAADESGARQFLMQEGLKRQGLFPMRQFAPQSGPALASAPVSSGIPQSRTYCVRTCDGYYFAIGFARSKGQLAEHKAMCSSSCGDASMKLFTSPVEGNSSDGRSGPAIERAADDTGALYTAMPTAFGFRTAETAACSCKSTANGLPQIPISIDPTLRNGDIIVTADGLKVFRGSSVGPHGEHDFVSVADANSLPSVVRQQMLSLQNRISE
jgi:hypothetical protein